MGSPKRRDGLVYQLPNSVAELDAFQILRQIIQPAQQTKWIPQRRPRRLTEARRNPQPSLLAQLDHDPILGFLNVDCERGLPAGHGTHVRGDLHCHFVLCADGLRVQVAAVEFRHQGMGNVARFYFPVKNSPVHDFDYNPLHPRRLQVVAFCL